MPLLTRLALALALSLLPLTLAASAADVGVRIRFGLTDSEPKSWDGTVTVNPGKVALISGWRFEQADRANGAAGWTASTRPAADFRTNAQKAKAKAAQQKSGKSGAKGKKGGAAAKAKAKAGAGNFGLSDNGVLLTLTDVNENSLVTVNTAQGDFTFKLSEIPYGTYITRHSGAVEIERTAAAHQVSSDTKTDDDYPSAAAASDGAVYVTYTSYTPGIDRRERTTQWDQPPGELDFLAKAPGGDQLFVRVVKDGRPADPIAVTQIGSDIYKSAVAVAADGTAWIFWSQNKNYQAFPSNGLANFEIYARPLKDGRLGQEIYLSQSAESDIWPVAAADQAGNVWLAWQAARDRKFRIIARRLPKGGDWSPPIAVSQQQGNCWAPAIAARTNVAIAWDTYDKGDYDIWCREFDSSGTPRAAQPVANTEDYEARPSITYGHDNSLWIAWEQSGPTWGKNWGALVQRQGIGLYRDRQIGLAVLKDGAWMEPRQLVVQALPGADTRVRVNNMRVPAIEPGAESRQQGEEAEARRNMPHNNIARIVADAAGRIWVLARARHNDFRSQIGSVWMTHATYLEGDRWTGPVLIPHTDNLLYNAPAAVPLPGGGVLVAHSSDHRQDRHNNQRGGNAGGALNGQDPFDNDLYLSRLEAGTTAKPPELIAAKVKPDPSARPSQQTVKERAALARARDYRAQIGDKSLQIVRGEFHRHTEISGDGGNDGPLEDMWRYAIDVAAMDWLGCGDHDNGGHREYTWWLTQKTTDAFRLPGAFDPPYSYERSVRYPEGHRNVIFTRRGIRTLPRLPITDRDNPIHAPDTQLLYRYLKHYDGICASHTSATSMGTDWRDNDPAVEPMVEIYQGARQNYERPGAPRSPTEFDAIGGWEPKGFINLALLKGYKFAFQASSDHGSTHISYCLVYAEDNTREGMFKAMKQRHVYGATDNIIADYRCATGGQQYIMGDAFTSKEPPTVKIKLVGTAPFSKVTLVKDDVEHLLGQPDKSEVEYEWTDKSPEAGKESYYYIRGEQTDGELVWASPMWITYQP